jgi:chromosome segregation ATPase
MSGEVVHARVSAVKEIANGIATYGRSLNAAVTSARADLNATGAEFQAAVAGSQRGLAAAERRTDAASDALACCRERCEPLQQELAEAKVAQDEARRRHERNRQAQAEFDRVASELISSMGATRIAAETMVPKARQHVQEYAETLTNYLRSRARR